MEQLDITIISTSLPSIARTLKIEVTDTSATLTAYIIGLTIFIPASGAVADRLGCRTTLFISLIIFTTASAACAFANNLTFFIIMRALAGVGGAFIFPVGKLIILRITPPERLVGLMTWLMLPIALGPLMGPTVGGFITTYASWRWNFYINVPICMIDLLMIWKYIPEIKEKNPSSFNVAGLIATGGGLACLATSVEFFTHNRAPGFVCLSLFATGCAIITLHTCYARAPFLDFSLLKLKIFRVAFTGAAASRIALGAFPFLLPLFLQNIIGLDAAQSGLMISCAPIGAIIMTPFIPALLRKWGFRPALIVNGLSAGVLGILITFCHPGQALWGLIFIILAAGVSQSILFSAYNTVSFYDVPPARMSAATSFYSTMEQMIIALGISLAAGTLTFSADFHHNIQPGAVDYSIAFALVGIVSSVAALAATQLPRDAGALLNKKPSEANI